MRTRRLRTPPGLPPLALLVLSDRLLAGPDGPDGPPNAAGAAWLGEAVEAAGAESAGKVLANASLYGV